jgi:hypothetical protein
LAFDSSVPVLRPFVFRDLFNPISTEFGLRETNFLKLIVSFTNQSLDRSPVGIHRYRDFCFRESFPISECQHRKLALGQKCQCLADDQMVRFRKEIDFRRAIKLQHTGSPPLFFLGLLPETSGLSVRSGKSGLCFPFGFQVFLIHQLDGTRLSM